MSEVIKIFVPGRLCIFGEHSDWAGLNRVMDANVVPGRAIVTGIDQGIYAEVKKAHDLTVKNESDVLADGWQDFHSTMDMDRLRDVAKSDSFFSYIAGTALHISEHYSVGGLDITITDMTLPIKSGLSSSAAICVLVARAYNVLYGLNLNVAGEMNVAYRGEHKTASRCGRLDQACAYGKSVVEMIFDGEDIMTGRVTVKKPLYWVIAALIGEKDTIKILSDLNKCFPFPSTETEHRVHEALGADNQRITEQAIDFMKHGDTEQLGRLMTEAQTLFDAKVAPASPEELASPALHRILADEKVRNLTYGGKGVGSQGDGSVQFLAKDVDSQRELTEYLTSLGMDTVPFTIPVRHQIRKAVIPVAGYGTRLYPMTRVVRKEFLPVFDSDGLVKPMILIALEQLLESGIEEICLVVGSADDIAYYRKAFMEAISEEHAGKLNAEQLKYEKRISEIGERLVFAVQEEKLGFGHAVYQSRQFSGGEPTLLVLGDTLHRSNTKKLSPVQLIERYEEYGRPLVAVQKVSLDKVRHVGVLAGEWTDENQSVMNVREFTEKPSSEYAREHLGMKRSGDKDRYFAVFGQYVLTSEIYDELGKMIGESAMSGGEYEMTDAFAAMIEKGGLYACVIDGMMFDIGNPEAYRETIERY